MTVEVSRTQDQIAVSLGMSRQEAPVRRTQRPEGKLERPCVAASIAHPDHSGNRQLAEDEVAGCGNLRKVLALVVA